MPSRNTSAQPLPLTADRPTPISFDEPADAATTLALVAADPAEETTTVAIDSDTADPQTGAVNDAAHGAMPQLALSPAQDAHGHISTGSTQLTVIPIGSWLQTDATGRAAPDLSIDGPADETRIDLGDDGLINLHGTLTTPGASIESVILTVNRRIIGTATLHQLEDALYWEFDTAVPGTGDYEFTVIATDRAGQETTQTVQAQVRAPEDDEVVVAPEATVLPTTVDVTEVQDNAIVFADAPEFIPGEIIISDATPNAPEGFLRRVAAIDRTANGWVVTTEAAALTEVILQANVSDTTDLLAAGEPGIETHNDGEPAVTLVSGADVDVAPYPNTGTDTEGIEVQPASFGIDTSLSHSVKLKTSFAAEASATKVVDLTDSDDEEKDDIETTISAKGGISLSAEAQLTLGLEVALHITAHWNWGRPDVVVEEFRLVTETSAKAEAEGKLTATLETSAGYSKKFEETLATMKMPTLTFSIGPVPVVITSEAKLNFKSKAEIKVKASTEISYGVKAAAEQTKRYGFRYGTMSGMNEINETSNSFQAPAFAREVDEELNGNFEVTFGPELSLDVKLYDITGPTLAVSVQPGVEAKIDFKADKLTTTAFIDAGSSGTVEFKVPILDTILLKTQLYSQKLRFTLNEWEWEFAAAFPAPDMPKVVETSSAWRHSLARTDDGRVYSWGANLFGQLGIDHSQDRILDPTPVTGLPEIAAIEAGEDKSFAVATNGEVYAWGLDYPGGGLGLGTNARNSFGETSPVKVPGLDNIASISSAGDNTFAVTNTGQVYGWGFNFNGLLGLGDDEPRLSPELIPGLSNIAEVETGGNMTFAVTKAGGIYAWGTNESGQLGLDHTMDQHTPVLIPGLDNIDTVIANGAHIFTRGGDSTYAITNNNEVYAWGSNDAGQLGIGDTQNQTSPVKVSDLPSIVSVTANGGIAFATTQGGEVYAWGDNSNGQLGLDDTEPRLSPVQMRGMTNMLEVSTGGQHTVAVKQGGTVYTWGRSYSGAAHDPAEPDPVQAEQPTPVRLDLPSPEQQTAHRQPAESTAPISN